MKTKKIVTKFSLLLIVFVASYLPSCERERWCAECNWICTSVEPLFGGTYERICANSFEECEAEIQDWLNGRVAPSCWDCTEPNMK